MSPRAHVVAALIERASLIGAAVASAAFIVAQA